MTRYRARPRPADPGHSRYLPRRHTIAHDLNQSLRRHYHGDYIISGSRLDLDASEKRVPAPRYIRLFSSSPYTAARPPRTRATRPRARRRKTFDGLAAFQPRRRPRARAERGPARLWKNSVASTSRPWHATATRRRARRRERLLHGQREENERNGLPRRTGNSRPGGGRTNPEAALDKMDAADREAILAASLEKRDKHDCLERGR